MLSLAKSLLNLRSTIAVAGDTARGLSWPGTAPAWASPGKEHHNKGELRDAAKD